MATLKFMLKLIGWTLGLVVLITIGGRMYYADLLNGPALQPTTEDISLKDEFPPPPGWSEELVTDAFRYADSLASAAVIVLYDGQVVAEWGATDKRISLHSVRKSLVSALFGIAVGRGMIDINMTLSELGIDDVNPPLTEVEKSARLVDLLTARSGIYHPSIKDDGGSYPEPGTHKPDEAFFYNNWSFNAVGGIFERLTNLSMGKAFKEWIADPIGMEDFRIEDVLYFEGAKSVFPAYRFWMSARDLARIGLLYMNDGRWGDQQIVPEDWIAKSFVPYSEMRRGVGYGYMWWTMPDTSYMATGTSGRKLRLYPNRKTVLVNRVDTGAGLRRAIWWNWGGRVKNSNTSKLLRRLETGLADVLTKPLP